ncbi:hypothetical protein LCGC14_0512010 [marine sediment metagenome]|uniref:Uncharacterized protein n=1 Tax=marine sediment metagenome TaxID=412755 RepID=A0A0F9S0X4_9ZZZZ
MLSAYSFAIGVEQKRFPYEASIKSALAIADEFCLICDPEYDNPEIFISIDPRVKLIETKIDFEWDFFSRLLTEARRTCSGDWCLLRPLDEVFHENDIDILDEEISDATDAGIEVIRLNRMDLTSYKRITYAKSKKSFMQYITQNKPYISHKTSDYMVATQEAELWNGKYLLKEYDEISYHDDRTKAWYCPNNFLNSKVPLWHYSYFNLSRKLQTNWSAYCRRIWGQNPGLTLSELETIFKEESIIDREYAKWAQKQQLDSGDWVKQELQHPAWVEDWVEEMII